jgi:uncharacterized Zn finger protein (UPF0148 family)
MVKIMNCPFCNSSEIGALQGKVYCCSCPAQLELQNTNTLYAIQLWNNRPKNSEIESLKAQVADLKSLDRRNSDA